MDKMELNKFRKLFIELKDNATLSLINLDLSTPTAIEENDQMREDSDKQLEFKLAARHKFYIRKINDALERIATGEFGRCDDCSQDIELSRLYARPTANLCIACKEEQEKEERAQLYERRSKTRGKELTTQLNIVKVNGEEVSTDRVIEFNQARAKIGLL